MSAPVPFGAARSGRIFAAFLGVGIAAGMITGGVFAVVQWIVSKRPPSEPLLSPTLVLGATLVGTVLAGLVVVRMLRRDFARPGGDGVRAAVGWRAAPWRAVALATLLGLALAGVSVAVSARLPVRPSDTGPIARATQKADGAGLLLFAVLAIAVAPPIEELLFRGVVYGGLARSWRPARAAIATTALFVAGHGSELGGYWPGWIVITLLGGLALRLRVATGSIWPAIALHAGYNFGVALPSIYAYIIYAYIYASRG